MPSITNDSCNTSTYEFGQIRKPADETVDLVVRSEMKPVASKQELVEVPIVGEAPDMIRALCSAR